MQIFPRQRPIKGKGLTCVDLFSGAGGFAEGFRQAGFQIISANDANEIAGKTFRANFPEASFFLGDICQLTGREILKDAGLRRGELDCLIGGPPCQAFSYNNHQRTHRSLRAKLFLHYLRLVKDLNPKVIVMENVPGILTIGNGSVVGQIFSELGLLGYECEGKILFAEEFGAPQERRRFFLIATRLGWADTLLPQGLFGPIKKPESNGLIHRWERRSAKSYQSPPTVWSAISDLPSLVNGETAVGGKPGTYRRPAGTFLQKLLRGRSRLVRNHEASNLGELMLKRIEHVPQGGSWRDIPRNLLTKGMKRAKPTDHTKRYGRLKKNGRCCTVLTKCDPHWGSYIHPESDRTITVREAARIQTFPDRFKLLGTRSEQYVQVGNAVPPLLAKALGRAIRKHL